MVDFRVHDSLPTHPKTINIPLAAIGLWTIAGAWSARHLTDGLIPTEILNQHKGWRPAATELVNRNLWTAVPGGYQFVDWDQYQRTRTQIETERAKARDRLQRWRDKKR